MYAITGASGKLGQLTINALLDRGVQASDIVAIVRTPAKVEDLATRGVAVRAADYDDADSWPAALADVDTLLLISGSENGQRVPQHTTVIDAAKTAGVQRIAYTSILKADTSTSTLAAEHLATEKLIDASGLQYTILRNSWYLENYLDQAENYIAQGALVSAAGDTPFTAATRADYAAAAAAALVDDGEANAILELGGDKITVAEMAAAVSQASGQDVEYRPVTPDELREILTSGGVPPTYVDLVVDIDRIIAAGELDTDSTDLARLVGRPLTTLAEAAKAMLSRR
ncbi:SDR family oxidoreductase [uncultured Jatrophihabitans sp.]|uniref:SDR family oxidoreductase n=1 Tax=uncultured Jatrophihabitans sp. TaxID=1610747 RepID=UPI0035CB182F